MEIRDKTVVQKRDKIRQSSFILLLHGRTSHIYILLSGVGTGCLSLFRSSLAPFLTVI